MSGAAHSMLSDLPDGLVDQVSALMRQAAAGIVLPLFRNLHNSDIHTKSNPHDYVTKADLDAEVFLTRELVRLLLGSLVVGEEAVSQDAAVLGRLNEKKWCWIIDPVDGTYEFKHGSTKFRMLVALAYDGVPVVGWILAPNVESKDADSQSVICAARGEGAWLNGFKTGQSIILPPEHLADGEIKGVLQRRTGVDLIDADSTLPQLGGGVRHTWCVGADFDHMVRRGADAVDWISFDRCHITPWDFAAPHVVLTEAGGVWHQDGGASYRPCKDNSVRFIAARSERVFKRVQERLYPEWKFG